LTAESHSASVGGLWRVGLYALLDEVELTEVDTPYGKPSDPLLNSPNVLARPLPIFLTAVGEVGRRF